MNIRKVILEKSIELRDLRLTSRQVYYLIDVYLRTELRSNDLSYIYDISVQSATSSLKKLYSMGYLDRVDAGAPSGGSEYVYSVVKDLRTSVAKLVK